MYGGANAGTSEGSHLDLQGGAGRLTHWGREEAFETSKPASGISSKDTTPPNPSQTVPLSDDSAFIYELELEAVAFSFKVPQLPSPGTLPS